jgi:hypothetical protein
MTLVVRFFEVQGDDLDADGGVIEVADDGLVSMSRQLDWIADLKAPIDPRDFTSASTRPAGGFERIGEDGDRVIFRPVGAWDPGVWLDRVRYHFRTPYLRPGEVELQAETGTGDDGVATDLPLGRIDTHVDVDLPNDDWVDPVDYWWATGEGWENIPPDQQAEVIRNIGPAQPGQSDGDPPGTTTR